MHPPYYHHSKYMKQFSWTHQIPSETEMGLSGDVKQCLPSVHAEVFFSCKTLHCLKLWFSRRCCFISTHTHSAISDASSRPLLNCLSCCYWRQPSKIKILRMAMICRPLKVPWIGLWKTFTGKVGYPSNNIIHSQIFPFCSLAKPQTQVSCLIL